METPETWLQAPAPWLLLRPEARITIGIGGYVDAAKMARATGTRANRSRPARMTCQ